MLKNIFKKSIVKLNLILSIGFGIIMGICFPLYSLIFVHFKSSLMEFIFCISCILAGIVVGLTAFLITQFTILRVVKSISLDLKNIAKGEGDLTKLINLESNDNLGELIYWFNMFVMKLCKMVDSSKKSILLSKNELDTLKKQMTDNSVSIKSIVESIQMIKDTQFKQNIKIENIENSLHILDDSIVIVIANVMEFFNQLDLLTNIVINQSNVIDEVIENISRISKVIGDDSISKNEIEGSTLYSTGYMLINSIFDLVGNSKQNTLKIEEHLKNIESISAKINLISINASIEATRSGTSGKGFRVIADEIRKFADLTKKFTNDIQALLINISNDMETGISGLDNNQNKYNTILNEVIKMTDIIHGSASEIKTVTEEIKSNYKTIGSLLLNLKNKIETLKESSSDSHLSLSELKDITEDIREQMELIDNEANEINNNNLHILSDFNTFVEGHYIVEEQISKYKTNE